VQETTEKDSESGITPDITDISQLRKVQASDPELAVIRGWLEHPKTVPDDNKFRTYNHDIQQLWVQRQSMEVKYGLLYRKYIRQDGTIQYWQLVIPYSLRTAFLDAIHAGAMNGHLGIEKTRAKLQEIAYLKG